MPDFQLLPVPGDPFGDSLGHRQEPGADPEMQAENARLGAIEAGAFTPGRVGSPNEPEAAAPSPAGSVSGLRGVAGGTGGVAEAPGAATTPGNAPAGRALTEPERAAQAAGNEQPLKGLPQQPIQAAGGYIPGPIARLREVARQYMDQAGLQYDPPETYAKVNPDRAKQVAQAFDDMEHRPQDPRVANSYNAMINETLAQYQAIKSTGLKIDFITPDMEDPYAATPRLASKDVRDNNHLWVYPTSTGHGSDAKAAAALRDNPLLAPTNEYINGKQLQANDVFRIVHDVFGHIKDGNGFRAEGEENAWRSHSAMYSDAARPAMTSETRGQNSWVNYGPHGEANRTASAADTVYSDQKVGLMPPWTWEAGRTDIAAPNIRNANAPVLDYEHLSPNVPNVPQFDLQRAVPAQGPGAKYMAANNPQTLLAAQQAVERGMKTGGLTWYNTQPLHDAYMEELGPLQGTVEFNHFIDSIAATSPDAKVMQNIRMGSYYNYLRKTGQPFPTVMSKPGTGNNYVPPGQIPEDYGSRAQALHVQNMNNLANGGMPALQNPKPPSFAENLRGNYRPVTIDRHNLSMFGLSGVPGKNYGYLEQLQQQEAARLGIAPAQYQASGWMDYADPTSRDPFIKLLDERIGITAQKYGLTKGQVLKRMIRGQMPLSQVENRNQNVA